MKIQKKFITDRIISLVFETQEELASTFLRFQEYYENPEFKGKVFTLDEFKDWHITTRGEFTYYKDWEGFNIPANALIPFYAGLFDELSDREEEFLDLLEGDIPSGKDFYIIGTLGNDAETLKHEIAHGLFYTNPKYHEEVLCIIADHDVFLPPFFNYLRRNYASSSWIDELHAYLLTDTKELAKAKIPVKTCAKLIADLDAVYEKYNPLKEDIL